MTSEVNNTTTDNLYISNLARYYPNGTYIDHLDFVIDKITGAKVPFSFQKNELDGEPYVGFGYPELLLYNDLTRGLTCDNFSADKIDVILSQYKKKLDCKIFQELLRDYIFPFTGENDKRDRAFEIQDPSVDIERSVLSDRNTVICRYKLVDNLTGESCDYEWTILQVPGFINRNMLMDYAVLCSVQQLRFDHGYDEVTDIRIGQVRNYESLSLDQKPTLDGRNQNLLSRAFQVPSSWDNKTFIKKVREMRELLSLPIEVFTARLIKA